MAARSDRLPPGVRPPEASIENDTLDHFERFCWTLRVPETGERFRLLEWELVVLEDYYAGPVRDPTYFQHLWEIPTGQGKSGLLGAMALHHGTYVVQRPRVFVVGGEIAHARNTTDAAANFVFESRKRNGLLGAWWDPQEHAGGRLLPMWLDDQDVGIFARSAGRSTERKGGSSVEGKNPTLILVEEKHRHEDGGAAVNTLVAKTIKGAAVGRAVKVVTITTAGTDKRSPLGQQIDKLMDEAAGATVQRGLRPDEHYVRAVDADGDTVGHLWAVPESVSPPRDDADGEELERFLAEVKKANPAPWITVKGLRRIWRSMTRHGRWMFLRQNANMWVSAGFSAIDRGQWWRLQVKGLQIPAGKGVKVYVGLDRASKWDTTAIVPVWKPDERWLGRNPKEDDRVRVAGAVLLPSPNDGRRRRTSDVADVLETMRQRWPDMVVVFDRNAGGGDVAEELEENHGLTVIDHDQGKAFDLASMRLGEYVEEGKLVHDGNEDLAREVLAAVMRERVGGKLWRGEAPDDQTPADGFDALAMALHMATQAGETRRAFNPDDYRIQQT